MNPLQNPSPEAPWEARVSSFPMEGVGAVVIGGDYQGLGIVRDLGRKGVPVFVIEDEFSISRFSRYATRSFRVTSLREDEKLIQCLLDVARRFNLHGWVLYPTRDESVAAISKNRDLLAQFFRVPAPHWQTVCQAWDKRNTYKLAAELGIPFPKSWFPETIADLEKVEGPFPLVLKPAIKEHFFYKARAKAWRADDRAQLIRRYQQASEFVPPGEMIIQEFIPGGSDQQFACGVFFKNSQIVGRMTTHNVRCHPPQFGRSSTFVETVALPRIAAKAERFLCAINYYGLAEIEFRLDPRDDQYKLIDVNARTWGYHSIGAAAGVNFSHMLFQDQLSQPVLGASARTGVTWVRLATDIPVGFHGAWLRHWGLWDYIKSMRRVRVETVLKFDDPVPELLELAMVPYLAVKRGY